MRSVSRLEQVVGEVRVGLHEAELEELAEDQPLERARRPRRGAPADARAGERPRSARRRTRSIASTRRVVRSSCTRGTTQRGLVGEQRRVAAQVLAPRAVVGLLAQLALRLVEDAAEIDLAGQERASRSSAATLSTSLSMLRATPGYWIFSARSRPSAAVAACTWPIEAAASGSKSNSAKRASQPGRTRAPSTRRTCASGMKSARGAQQRERLGELAAAACPSPSSESSWPSFIAAPRSRERRCARRRAFARMKQRARGVGRGAAEEAARALDEAAGRELAGHPAEAREALEAARRNARSAPRRAFVTHSARTASAALA